MNAVHPDAPHSYLKHRVSTRCRRLTQSRHLAMSALWSLSGDKRTSQETGRREPANGWSMRPCELVVSEAGFHRSRVERSKGCLLIRYSPSTFAAQRCAPKLVLRDVTTSNANTRQCPSFTTPQQLRTRNTGRSTVRPARRASSSCGLGSISVMGQKRTWRPHV